MSKKLNAAAVHVGVRIEVLNSAGVVIESLSSDAFHLLNRKHSLPDDSALTTAHLTYFVRGEQYLCVQVPVITDSKWWWLDPDAFEDSSVAQLRRLALPRIDNIPKGTASAFAHKHAQPWPVRPEIVAYITQHYALERLPPDALEQKFRDIHNDNKNEHWQHYMPQRSLLRTPIEKHMKESRPSKQQQQMYRAFQGVPGVFTTTVDLLLREYYQHIEYGLDLGRYTALNLLLLASARNIQYQCSQVAYSTDLLLNSSLKLCPHTSVSVFEGAYYGELDCNGKKDLRCAQCTTKTEIFMALSYVQKDRKAMQTTLAEVIQFAQLLLGQASLILWIDKVATRAAIAMGISETEWIKYGLVSYTLIPVLSTVGATGEDELEHARTSIWLQIEALAARTALGCYFTRNASRKYSALLQQTERQMPTLGCGTTISVGKTTGALCSLKRMMAAVNERENLKPSEYWKEYYGGFRKWALALISSLNADEDKQVLEFKRKEPIAENWPVRESVLLMQGAQESGNFVASAMAVDDLYDVGNLEHRRWHAAFTYMSQEEKDISWRVDIMQRVRMDRLRELFYIGIGSQKRAVFCE